MVDRFGGLAMIDIEFSWLSDFDQDWSCIFRVVRFGILITIYLEISGLPDFDQDWPWILVIARFEILIRTNPEFSWLPENLVWSELIMNFQKCQIQYFKQDRSWFWMVGIIGNSVRSPESRFRTCFAKQFIKKCDSLTIQGTLAV